nr:nucleotide disphospho-sugar-binding domain-containing protein [Rhodococcus sp. HNM0569]
MSLLLRDAGDEVVLYTGERWRAQAGAAGVDVRLLPGLAPRPEDDDLDAGARIHARAAYIATELMPLLRDLGPDLIVSDILTAGGGLAAEMLGIAWIELSPHPLYAPSRGLPPIGSGLARGEGLRGRLRDAVMRAATARSIAQGLKQRARARTGIGLPARDPGPTARMIATLPALEVPRPDWPEATSLVGPLLWEPTEVVLAPAPGDGPLVMVAPSTAFTGAEGMVDAALTGLEGTGVRVIVSVLDGSAGSAGEASWVSAGLGRQDAMLADADVVVCGAGHGMLAKALLHGVPVVAVPGGGDQWELANRAARQGSAVVVRPATPDALRDAVETVLGDPRFRDAAQRAAASAASVHDPVAVCRTVVARAR